MSKREPDLRDLFERHVLYEILMLIGTRECIHAGEADTIKHNALIESFCIHARLLIDFFENPDAGGPGSLTEPGYIAFEGARMPDALVKRINKQIAHFSLKRTIDPSKTMDGATLEAIYSHLDAEIANFQKHLKSEYRPLWPAALVIEAAPEKAGPAQDMARASL